MSDEVSRTFPASVYDVRHLATFTADNKPLRPEDGMRRLKTTEKKLGLCPYDCTLIIQKDFLIVFDRVTGQEIETIPLRLIHEPTSVVIDNSKEAYNNVLLFTVMEEPKSKNLKPSEMHIFQCVKVHSTKIVDDLVRTKENLKQIRTLPSNLNNSIITTQEKRRILNGNDDQSIIDYSPKYLNQMPQRQIKHSNLRNIDDQTYKPFGESLEQDVQILNHCFDDIEKFYARLLNAISYSTLTKLKTKNSGKKSTNNVGIGGGGILTKRSQMPSQESFVDILQKFKLSFNLLANLKAHIHDPNAPELVHILFKPLRVIFKIITDSTQIRGLTKTIWTPLITRDCKDLLLNCLTSKEQDLWQALGDAWSMSRDEARVLNNIYVEPYSPIFYDGWSPTLEQNDNRSEISRIAVKAAQQQALIQQAQNRVSPAVKYKQRNLPKISSSASNMQQYQNDDIMTWALNLQYSGIKVYEALYNRNANNNRELTLEAGEPVEVLDNKRNWWRVRNYYGEIGYVPNTILQPFNTNATIKFASFPNRSAEIVGYF